MKLHILLFSVILQNKIHADQCLELKLELKLNGTLMQVFPALEKKKIMNKALNKHPDKKKDNRNLYLVKEGGTYQLFANINMGFKILLNTFIS